MATQQGKAWEGDWETRKAYWNCPRVGGAGGQADLGFGDGNPAATGYQVASEDCGRYTLHLKGSSFSYTVLGGLVTPFSFPPHISMIPPFNFLLKAKRPTEP